MIGQFRLQRSLQDCFGELFQQAVLADDVFRLLVIGQQLINEGLVDSHRFLILLFRWSFTQLLLQLRLVSSREWKPTLVRNAFCVANFFSTSLNYLSAS